MFPYQVISEGKVLTPLFRITVAWEVGNGQQAVKVYEAKSPQQAWQGTDLNHTNPNTANHYTNAINNNNPNTRSEPHYHYYKRILTPTRTLTLSYIYTYHLLLPYPTLDCLRTSGCAGDCRSAHGYECTLTHHPSLTLTLFHTYHLPYPILPSVVYQRLCWRL